MERRETTRENKALVAANLDKAIEKELLERVTSGVYGETPINVKEDVWQKFLQNQEMQHQQDEEEESDVNVYFI